VNDLRPCLHPIVLLLVILHSFVFASSPVPMPALAPFPAPVHALSAELKIASAYDERPSFDQRFGQLCPRIPV
jgi:hypothetical protein